MHNHTKTILYHELLISLGYVLPVFGLLCILIIILIILYLFFKKQQDGFVLDEYELSNDRSTNANKRSLLKCPQTKQRSSTGSFRMNLNGKNTDSYINLVSSK